MNVLYICGSFSYFSLFFFFNDTATTEIYTLSLHDALPIGDGSVRWWETSTLRLLERWQPRRDRKSTRLNSSHMSISYAVFCLKKKKKKIFHYYIKKKKKQKNKH